MLPLNCVCQNYEWGKRGGESAVAQLSIAGNPTFSLENDKAYAELWMGTHAKGPSKVAGTQQQLSQWLFEHPDALGDALKQALLPRSNKETGIELPFLFKVLSVNKALSIQVHPTKEQAIMLHKADAKNYPDSNYKPEMAIALTPFELMCGFRPAAEIVKHIESVPELLALIGSEKLQALKACTDRNYNDPQLVKALRDCFAAMMQQSGEKVHQTLSSLIGRLSHETVHNGANGVSNGNNLCVDELVLRLSNQFPGDIGCLGPYFFNSFILQPGEATFLGPNEPHAYLSGDCIECMACSDNTIRAGLTPKFKDVPHLIEMLTYRTGGPIDNKLPSSVYPPSDSHVTQYKAPVPDFGCRKIEFNSATVSSPIAPMPTCSITIVVSGVADTNDEHMQRIQKGSIFLLPANTCITLSVVEAPLLMFQAYCNVECIEQLFPAE